MLLWRSLTLQRLSFGLAGMADDGPAAATPATVRFERPGGSGRAAPAAATSGEERPASGTSAHPKIVPLASAGGDLD